MCVSRNICLKQKSLWIYCLASWKAQLSIGLFYLGSLKPEGKSISIRDYRVPFLSWDGIWGKVTDIRKLSYKNELFLSGATDVWFTSKNRWNTHSSLSSSHTHTQIWLIISYFKKHTIWNHMSTISLQFIRKHPFRNCPVVIYVLY